MQLGEITTKPSLTISLRCRGKLLNVPGPRLFEYLLLQNRDGQTGSSFHASMSIIIEVMCCLVIKTGKLSNQLTKIDSRRSLVVLEWDKPKRVSMNLSLETMEPKNLKKYSEEGVVLLPWDNSVDWNKVSSWSSLIDYICLISIGLIISPHQATTNFP